MKNAKAKNKNIGPIKGMKPRRTQKTENIKQVSEGPNLFIIQPSPFLYYTHFLKLIPLGGEYYRNYS